MIADALSFCRELLLILGEGCMFHFYSEVISMKTMKTIGCVVAVVMGVSLVIAIIVIAIELVPVLDERMASIAEEQARLVSGYDRIELSTMSFRGSFGGSSEGEVIELLGSSYRVQRDHTCSVVGHSRTLVWQSGNMGVSVSLYETRRILAFCEL